MKANARDHIPMREVTAQMHERMIIADSFSIAARRFEPRFADPPEYKRTTTHRPQKRVDRFCLFKVSGAELTTGQEFENLCVVIGPEPPIAGKRPFSLGYCRMPSIFGKIDLPIHATNEELGCGNGVRRQRCHGKEATPIIAVETEQSRPAIRLAL